ncbi:hypothetical protein HKX48_002678 [Thoreauomyces humboldtii]|nr:hypothetical protein HKX48_002678 [Thoreauomyces humboldtii]
MSNVSDSICESASQRFSEQAIRNAHIAEASARRNAYFAETIRRSQIKSAEKAAREKVAAEQARARIIAERDNHNVGPNTLADYVGSYSCVCPGLTEMWPDFRPQSGGEPSISISCTNTTGRLWGEFDFGVIRGYLRCVKPYAASAGVQVPATLVFSWRVYESVEDTMDFGEDITIELSVVGPNRLSGWITSPHGLIGSTEINLTQIGNVHDPLPHPRLGSRPTFTMRCKKGYRAINEGEYNRRSVARWGKWGGEDDEGRPDRSDTDYESAKEDDEDEHGIYDYGMAY